MKDIRGKNQTLIYDGNCHICLTMAKKARLRILDERLRFLQSQDYISNDDYNNVDVETLNKSVVYISDDVVYTGTDAIIKIIKQMNGYWKAIGYILSMPGIKQLFGICYRLFARHRHYISDLFNDIHLRRDL